MTAPGPDRPGILSLIDRPGRDLRIGEVDRGESARRRHRNVPAKAYPEIGGRLLGLSTSRRSVLARLERTRKRIPVSPVASSGAGEMGTLK